jgi:hypothetical protein
MRSPFPSREVIVAKKVKQEREGKVNMASYLAQQQHTLDKTARLRALRLAQEANEPNPAKRRAATKNAGSRPGLHQDAR